MKGFLLLLLCTALLKVNAQLPVFPKDWTGNWKGELQWFKTGADTAQKVPVQLRIHPTGSEGKYTWQLIYGNAGQDNRPYILVPKDSTGVHWVVDEQNGILLDQYWVGHRLCGSFTVMNSTITNCYWMEADKLNIEFISNASKPIATTGEGSAEIPLVDSYRISGYQRAVLTRQ